MDNDNYKSSHLNKKVTNSIIPMDFNAPEGPRLECPVCEGTNIYPIGIICEPICGIGQGFIRINSDGVSIVPSWKEPKCKGGAIDIDFMCNEGHTFSYTFSFDNGKTTVHSIKKENEDVTTLSTIWDELEIEDKSPATE